MRFEISYCAAVVAALLSISSCGSKLQRTQEVVAAASPRLPVDPVDSLWNAAPEHVAQLVPQDLVEPRLMHSSTPEVLVRSLTNGAEIAFRLEWSDANRNDLPGPGGMVDACAVQIPEKIEPDLPEPQMGQAGRTVQVTYWRADWQASVDGRGDTIRDLYPNASIDHYPFDAPGADAPKELTLLYAPARALGNLRAGPRAVPVEDLIATGPGTLTSGPSLGAKGKGRFSERGWSVVIVRRLPEGLVPNQRTHLAVAVWQGSQQESGSRKMRSGWIPLVRRQP